MALADNVKLFTGITPGAMKLKKRVVFPKGAQCSPCPNRVSRVGADWASVLIALDKDATAELTMPLDDARRLGFV